MFTFASLGLLIIYIIYDKTQIATFYDKKGLI